jgi:transaldolase
MKILIASVDPVTIKAAMDYGVHGIITNPTVIAEAKRPWREAVREAAATLPGPFHLQVTADDRDDVIRQAEEFAEILDDRLVVKIMISREGLAAAQALKRRGFAVDVTGVVSGVQAAVAVQTGVDYVALYLGRADRAGIDGVALVEEVAGLIAAHGYPTEIVAASIQGTRHLYQAALAGADWAACPLSVLEQAVVHPVTEASIADFKRDWATVPGEA